MSRANLAVLPTIKKENSVAMDGFKNGVRKMASATGYMKKGEYDNAVMNLFLGALIIAQNIVDLDDRELGEIIG